MTFGEWLRQKRKEKDLNQPELSDRTDGFVAVSTISSIERGERQASVERVDALARALGADVNQARVLAGFAPKQPIPPAKPQNLEELLERLKELGVEGPLFFDEEAVKNADPEALQDILDAVQRAVELELLRHRHRNDLTHNRRGDSLRR